MFLRDSSDLLWLKTSYSLDPQLTGLQKDLAAGAIKVLDATDPAVSGKTIPTTGQTAKDFFSSTGYAAYTVNSFIIRRGRARWQGATIYLGPLYFSSPPDWQAGLDVHELLHAETHIGDEFRMSKAAGAGGGDVTQWLINGCP